MTRLYVLLPMNADLVDYDNNEIEISYDIVGFEVREKLNYTLLLTKSYSSHV